MQPELIGPLQVYTAGGSVRRGQGQGPAILLCHGYGATGEDLVELARMVDAGREVRWFFPEAPLAIEFDGFVAGQQWWPLDIQSIQELTRRGQSRSLASETPFGLAEARADLEATIAELERTHHVRPDQLIIGGFSQGAMLTTEIALHREGTPFAGLVVFSGNLVSEDRWAAAARKTGPKLHALVTHGRADPMLPFNGAIALRDLLLAAGAHVEWVAHQGQHEIPPAALSGLAAFARARLGTGTK
jgi:phospholipase/carboxylesterase